MNVRQRSYLLYTVCGRATLLYQGTSTVPSCGQRQEYQVYKSCSIALTHALLSVINTVGTHPLGLSGSLFSPHLNVTLLATEGAVTGDPWVVRPFCTTVCPTLTNRFSSSSSSARKEHKDGGD